MTQGIFCTLWSSDKVFSTHHAHGFWNSSPSVILTTIPHVRLNLHCSLLAVILQFSETVFYTILSVVLAWNCIIMVYLYTLVCSCCCTINVLITCAAMHVLLFLLLISVFCVVLTVFRPLAVY